MKHILTALATFAALAILGKQQRRINALTDEVTELQDVRNAMACELMHQAKRPAVVYDNRLTTEH